MEQQENLKNLNTFLQVFMGKEAETFLNAFMYFYQTLGDDSKIFFERLLQEAENVKNRDALNKEDFASLFQEEFKNLFEKQSLSTQNAQIIEQSEKNLLQEQNSSEEIPNKESLKIFTLPMDWENFRLNINLIAKEILKNNTESLKNMNLYTEQNIFGTSVGIYSQDHLFSEEKIKEFQKEYAKNYIEKLSEEIGMKLEFLDFNANNDIIIQSQSRLNQIDFIELVKNAHSRNNQIEIKNLNWNFDIKQIKEFHKESKDFIDIFENEIQELERAKELSNSQSQTEQNQNSPKKNKQDLEKPQYASLLDFFEKKRIENQNLSISKDEFKKDFLNYCKTNMNEQEMRTLVSLYQKTPTKLTKEHKEMIAKGMRYNLVNNNLLDKSLETSIKKVLVMSVPKEEKIKKIEDEAQVIATSQKTQELQTINDKSESKVKNEVKQTKITTQVNKKSTLESKENKPKTKNKR